MDDSLAGLRTKVFMLGPQESTCHPTGTHRDIVSLFLLFFIFRQVGYKEGEKLKKDNLVSWSFC